MLGVCGDGLAAAVEMSELLTCHRLHTRALRT